MLKKLRILRWFALVLEIKRGNLKNYICSEQKRGGGGDLCTLGLF